MKIRLAAAVGALGLAGLAVVGPSANADTGSGSSLSFVAAAQASVYQYTEDEPSATFHPEAEGNYVYTLATLDQSHGYALSSLVWPGGAAGNPGALAVVLGAPSQLGSLNDPVRAEATTGSPQAYKSVSAPGGATMSASATPETNGKQDATAHTAAAGDGATFGSADSVSTINKITDAAGNTDVSASAASFASNVNLAGGVFHVGSFTSTAQVSTKGPASGQTVFSDMTIGGVPAYVDGNGVHQGKPGQPPNAEQLGILNTALASAGMHIYFTSPHTIPVGGVKYYYSASVLVFWAPPGDPTNNSFTVSLGGAAVTYTGSVVNGSGGPSVPTTLQTSVPSSGTTGLSSPVVQTSGPTNLQLPTAPGGPTPVALPVTQPATVPTVATPQATPIALAATTPKGIGIKWVALLLAGGALGALGLPRIPGLLSASGDPGCERERRYRYRQTTRSP